MKILVDADACPVKEIIVRLAKRYNIPVFMYCDTSHVLYDNYSTIITVDKASDSADIELINNTCKGDIVITQDYGVATMALSMKAIPVSQNGLIYNDSNIDRLLFERHLSKKMRRAKLKSSSHKKRTPQNDIDFEKCLTSIILG